jgi:hypothetical protein
LLTAVVVAMLATGCGSSSVAGRGSPAPSPTPTGNGVADLSAPEILARAKTAFQNADTVRIKGWVLDEGRHLGLDVHIKGSAGGRGTLTIDGQSLEILRIGQTGYLKGDEAFWRGQTGNAEAAKLLKGKYLAFPTTNPEFKDLAGFTDVKAIGGKLADAAKVKKGSRQPIRGIETVGLIEAGPDGSVLYVALQGKPYPLRSVPNEGGAVDYLDYGKPVSLTAPPADQVIDISKLGGR